MARREYLSLPTTLSLNLTPCDVSYLNDYSDDHYRSY